MIAVCLMADKVPSGWSKVWDGPEKPATWIAQLTCKVVGIKLWESKANGGSLLDEELDLNDVFRPLTFLNSLRQLTARQTNCAMDVLHFVSAWSNVGINSPVLINVKGLLLQGAELRGTLLVEASRDTPEIIFMPSLILGYSQERFSCSSNDLGIPLYRDVTREYFLVEISLPTHKDAGIWILAGLALFLTEY